MDSLTVWALCETVETRPAGRTTVYDAIRAKHVVSTQR